MAAPDIARFTRDPDLHRAVGRAFLALAGSHENETEETFADAGSILESLAFLTALLIEFNPAARTPRDLRLISEDISGLVLDYAKAIRAGNETRPKPLIMEFGALRPVEMAHAGI